MSSARIRISFRIVTWCEIAAFVEFREGDDEDDAEAEELESGIHESKILIDCRRDIISLFLDRNSSFSI